MWRQAEGLKVIRIQSLQMAEPGAVLVQAVLLTTYLQRSLKPGKREGKSNDPLNLVTTCSAGMVIPVEHGCNSGLV